MLVWMDLEMTGLDHTADVIVEIATLVTDDEPALLGGAVLEHADDERQAVLGGVDADADPDVLAGELLRPGVPLLGSHE